MSRLLRSIIIYVAFAHVPAHAQHWPSKPVRLVAPVGAGSGADIVARIIAERLSDRLKQTVIVDNRPGAAANIGAEIVARAAPDGYTFLYALTNLAINPHLYKLSFDPLKDFVPVALIARYQFVLLARPSFPANSIKDIVALAGARPASLTCGYSSGNFHIGCALLGALGRVDIRLIPYKSAPQIMADLLAGRIDLSFNAANAVGYAVSRGAIAVAMTSHRERAALANLPAIGETLNGFDLSSWQGLVAPAGTPADVIRRLNRGIDEVLREPAIRNRLESSGVEVAGGAPSVLGTLILQDYRRYGAIIRQTGIRVE